MIGTVLGRRFRVEERVAAGGFGVIYRATHMSSKYEVALKVLHENKLTDEKIVARFRREAQTLTTLRSPHTVTTYELVQEPDGKLFMVMELLRGETLYLKFKREGALPWRRVVEIARAVCESLAEAHALGVVHRDLKPENIVLEPRDGQEIVKVLDFGIAKVLPGSEVEHAEELTNHNEVIGTWDYVSPEQIRSEAYSGRSDIYTLGVVMYEMITGTRPFANVTGPALMAAILTTPPPGPSTRLPGIPPALDDVLLRCLEPEPERRFDVRELADALDNILASRPDDNQTKQVVIRDAGPDEDQTRILSKPEPVRVAHAPPYATPMGMPIVAPPPASELLDSGPIEPPAPRSAPPPLPPRASPTLPPPVAPPRPAAPPPLVSGWATAPSQPLPQPAFAKALERDRMMARLLWGTVLAIAIGVGIVLAFVL